MRLLRPAVALLLIALWIGPSVLSAPDVAPGVTPLDLLGERVQPALVVGCIVLALVAAAWRWQGLGLGPPRRGTLPLLWLPGVYLLLFAAGAALGEQPVGALLPVLLANTLLVGLVEEGLFRGFLYSGLRDVLRPWPAILATSALFGLGHLPNAAWTGDLGAATLQGVVTAGLGFLLLAVRVRTGSIWPAVLIHAAWNLGLLLIAVRSGAAPGAPVEARPGATAAWLVPLLLFLPLPLYGLHLLRGVGRDGDGLGPGPARSAGWQPSRVPRVGGPRR